MKKKILILGINGMLGSMVFDYFLNNKIYEVYGTTRKEFDVENNNYDIIEEIYPDYIINCIGMIKPYIDENNIDSIKRAIDINSIFPLKLKDTTDKNIKVIQIATDCVYNGKIDIMESYNEYSIKNAEDIYGKSKLLGEIKSDNFIILRCSILGPELEKREKSSLFNWVMSQPKNSEINGFDNHLWNGITTLQFAKICEEITSSDVYLNSKIQHIVPKDSITKYKLLNLICEIFNRKDIKINKVQAKDLINRRLSTIRDSMNNILWNNNILSVKEMLIELKIYLTNKLEKLNGK